MPNDKSKAPKGVSLLVGLGAPSKGSEPKASPDDVFTDEPDLYDDAIGEFIDLVQSGDREAAISSFKDVLDAAYARWMDSE